MQDLEFDAAERAYLLEHFRSNYNKCAKSERPGASDTAETWDKLQRLFVTATK